MRYQVTLIDRPANWKAKRLDAVPSTLSKPRRVLTETEDVFAAVARAMEHNASSAAEKEWAVVVEPGRRGRVWPALRLCSPLNYKVTAIWWPQGWEPHTPLDVPNCVWRSLGSDGNDGLSREEAESIMAALNRQCMDRPGNSWHVIVAVENEPMSRTVNQDPSGLETTVETRRIHVIRPAGGGSGDCTYCPAHDFSCSRVEVSPPMKEAATMDESNSSQSKFPSE